VERTVNHAGGARLGLESQSHRRLWGLEPEGVLRWLFHPGSSL